MGGSKVDMKRGDTPHTEIHLYVCTANSHGKDLQSDSGRRGQCKPTATELSEKDDYTFTSMWAPSISSALECQLFRLTHVINFAPGKRVIWTSLGAH